MVSNSDTEEKGRQPESSVLQHDALPGDGTIWEISDPHPGYEVCTRVSSGSKLEGEENVITNIQATDVTFDLRRLPACFYILLRHGAFACIIESNTSINDDDVVEWSGSIPIPSNRSAALCIEVCTSLRLPYTFSAKAGGIASPRSSIFVDVKQCKVDISNASTVLLLLCPTTASRGGLEDMLRYWKLAVKRTSKPSVSPLEYASDAFPGGYPSHAATLSNLAMAKLTHSQLGELSPEIPVRLHHKACAICPVSGGRRPSTLFRLAMAHFTRFQEQGDEVKGIRAEALLRDVVENSSFGSHEHQCATFLLQLHAERGQRANLTQVTGQSRAELYSAPFSTHRNPITHLEKGVGSIWIKNALCLEGPAGLGAVLLWRFEHFEELKDLEAALLNFKDALQFIPHGQPDQSGSLGNIGTCYRIRFEHSGDVSDLEAAISSLKAAVENTHDDHPNKPSCLNNLGSSLRTRFQCLGDLNDLDAAISILKEAVELNSRCHPSEPAFLINLGIALQIRAEHVRDPCNLEASISSFRDAVEMTPHDDPNAPNYLDALGNAFHTRFLYLGNSCDLHSAILIYKDAVRLTPHGDPNKSCRLSNLGNSFKSYFECLGHPGDLEAAISCFREALGFTADSNPDKPSSLSDLGYCFRIRFRQSRDLRDLEAAIANLRDAVGLTPNGHISMHSRLNNLANYLVTRFEHVGDLDDLDAAISCLRDAVDIIPHDHPGRPDSLGHLGSSFLARFQSLGDLSDLDAAISSFTDVVLLIPHSYPNKRAYLDVLGDSLRIRFHRIGDLSDLDAAISNLKDATDLTPRDHPNKFRRLESLGDYLIDRFKCCADMSDLQAAISSLKDAIELIPHGHLSKASCLTKLGSSLRTQFGHLGDVKDLDAAISSHRDAVESIPHGHPNKSTCLYMLGSSYRARFLHSGDSDDLNAAITRLGDAVESIHHAVPDKSGWFNSLALSFHARFERLGDLGDLEAAVSSFRAAVGSTPHDYPSKPRHLNNLANSLLTRFERLGDLSDIENAILSLRDALDLLPVGHPDKSTCLSSLGACFGARFECLRDPSDLEASISSHKEAMSSSPDGPAIEPLINLAVSFQRRFQYLGDLSDLEAAILIHRDTVEITPDGHSNKRVYLSQLGKCFLARFERIGDLRDLETAVLNFRKASECTPDGHPNKPNHLRDLGNTLTVRFEHLGDPADLEAAISDLSGAVKFTPQDHPDKPGYINDLSRAFFMRFEHLGDLKDLEVALSGFKDAVEFIPQSHPRNYAYLNNLGMAFKSRFEYVGDPSDLGAAIDKIRLATNFVSNGHPEKSRYLTNLGDVFLVRFESFGDLCDLDTAISSLRNAVELTPDGHHLQSRRLNSLGDCFETRFDHTANVQDLEDAISIYSHSAYFPTGSIPTRFNASKKWISCARRIHHPSLLRAYSVAINLLPQLAWVGNSLALRYSDLQRGADVVREAAATALDSGNPQLAVEWLERGRSVAWAEMLHLRGSYEDLSSVHPDHANRLRKLSAALDSAGATRELLSTLSESEEPQSAMHHASLQDEAGRQRQLAIDRDNLLREIRRLPGFEQFLLHKDFSQLRASAHSGPVVLINVAESRCDALIILESVDHPIHVPLPNFSFKRAIGYQNLMKGFLREARATRSDIRIGRPVPRQRNSWKSFLASIWKCIVKPVLDALAFSSPGNLSRIFWCPTGPLTFLPLHAAGFYGPQFEGPGHKVFDFVVSSYVPTLAVLAPLPNHAVLSKNIQLLAVPQPLSDGYAKLPGVVPEMQHISAIIKKLPSPGATFVQAADGTVEEVLGMMKDADWVHFACHGIQDDSRPTQSGLCLAHGQRLKISDIITLSRPRRGLAFLSACQTAMGDEGLLDEAVHIAAGMLFAGYGGVIGTMWSISDRIAPDVAGDVYKYLFRNGARPDYREAARALHEAMGRLREDEGVAFSDWIPFIHVGL